jgi:hypothetical protein
MRRREIITGGDVTVRVRGEPSVPPHKVTVVSIKSSRLSERPALGFEIARTRTFTAETALLDLIKSENRVSSAGKPETIASDLIAVDIRESR